MARWCPLYCSSRPLVTMLPRTGAAPVGTGGSAPPFCTTSNRSSGSPVTRANLPRSNRLTAISFAAPLEQRAG